MLAVHFVRLVLVALLGRAETTRRPALSRTGHSAAVAGSWCPAGIIRIEVHVLVAIAFEVHHEIVGFEHIELNIDEDPNTYIWVGISARAAGHAARPRNNLAGCESIMRCR